MRRLLAAVAVAALGLTGATIVLPGPAAAASLPGITAQKSGPAQILAGGSAAFTLTAANPSSNPGVQPEYNATFRDVLPAGVSYLSGSTRPSDVGEPTLLSNEPATGQTTLLWTDVFDLQPGAASSISFSVQPNTTSYPVGALFSNTAGAFASTDPRTVPQFASDGTPIAGSQIQSATSNTTTTDITAISIAKTEPSVEAKLLRGVHDHPTVYSVPVTNNSLFPTTGVIVTDLLPANLEFLGCGGADNSSAPEYPGAGSLAATPVITAPNPADADPVGCPVPVSVATVSDPSGYPAGIYTVVTWSLGTLSPDETYTINYAAGVPLRENVLFPDTGPSAASGLQAANLDNNTGPSTRQSGSAATATNYAHAVGTYQGPVAAGSSTTVTADTQHTVSVNDLRIHKSVSPTTFSAGGLATYTLQIDASEYADSSNISVTDVLPNGVCPVDNVTNYTSGAPADCAPAPADCPTGTECAPSVPFQSVTQNADGTFTVVFDPIAALSHDASTTITYYGRMRTHYTGGPLAGDPTVAGDSFTNNATEVATTTPAFAGTGETGPFSVTDSTSATQSTDTESLSKLVAARATPMNCSTAGYQSSAAPAPASLTFALGDRVCFEITIDFPNATETRNAVLTDFLPTNTSYEAGSYTPGPANTLPAAAVSFDSSQAATDGTISWTLGTPAPSGALEVPLGSVFQARYSVIVTAAAVGPAPDKAGNLAKLRSENSDGDARSLRSEADFAIAPAPIGIVKGVASVNGVANPGGGDHVQVKEGDVVGFHVDVNNTSNTTTNPPAVAITSPTVWDVLPQGVTCALVTLISDSGGCTDPGAGAQPSFSGNGTHSAIVWSHALTIAPGATHTYTYSVTVPAAVSVADELVNTAYVRSYDTATNQSSNSTQVHYPADNVDTTVNPALEDPNPASDGSDVYLPSVTLTKGVTSAINEAGNSGAEPAPVASTQATPGESVTYTVSATIPAGTTVYSATLTDPLPAGITQDSVTAKFAPNAAAPSFGSLPSGVTLSTGTGTSTLAFGGSYNNSTSTDQLFVVTITGHVNPADTTDNVAGASRVNTAAFASVAGPDNGPTPSPVTASATVQIVEPRPTLTKTNNYPAPGTVAGGSVITYTLTAGNAAGASVLHDSWTVDCVPAGLTFSAFGSIPSGTTAGTQPGAGPGGNNVSCATGTTEIDWNTGDISPGQTKTLTYTATVPITVVGQVSYTNVAALTGSSLAGSRATPTSTGSALGRNYATGAQSTVTAAGAGLVKTATAANPTIGATINYTLTATLPANVNFYNTSLIDALPSGTSPSSVQLGSVSCLNADSTSCTPNTASALTTSGSTIGWLLGDAPASTQVRTVTLTYTAVIADVVGNTAGVTLTNTAHVAWDTTSGSAPTSATQSFDENGPNAQASVTVTEPKLFIAKSVSNSQPQPGQSFTYTVKVSNASGSTVSPAYNITLSDPVPTGVVVNPASISGGGTITGADPTTGGGTITWTFSGPLAPGATVNGATGLTYTATLAPSATLTSAALKNTATVTGYDSLPAGGRHYSGRSASATVTPLFPAITAAKTTPAGSTAYVGSPLTWQVTITDATTAGTAYQVGATDTLPPNWSYDAGSAQVVVNGGAAAQVEPQISTSGAVSTLTWPAQGTLPPGAQLVITYSATPSAAALSNPGVGLSVNHTNTVTPSGADATGATGNASGSYSGPAATANAHLASADVVITKSVGSIPVAGSTGSWTLTVTDDGPDPAVGPFTVIDTFDNPAPSGVSNVQASGTGWTCTTVPITCQRTNPADTLADGASFPAVTVTYSVDASESNGTTYTNSANVTARTYDPDTANNTASASTQVSTQADLGITKTLDTALTAGQDATYAITVTNYGPSISRGPITVSDALPAGTSFVSADGGSDWNCPDPVGGTLTCTTGSLAVGQVAAQILVTVHVAAATTTAVVNSATVHPTTAEPSPDVHSDTATVTTTPGTSADLSIVKSLVGSVVAGSPSTYTLTVSNAGPSDAANVVVTDTLPALFTYQSFTGSDWDCGAIGQVVTCDYTAAPALPAGDSSTITLNLATGQQVAGAVLNTADVDSSTSDPDSTNNSSTSNSDVTDSADLSITKTHTGTAVAGQNLDYTLRVHNFGPSDESGPITVTDTLPAGMSFVSADGGPAWNCTDQSGTVTCTGANNLADGADATPITLTVLIDHAVSPGTLTNTADVAGGTPDPDLSNNSSSDPTDVTASAHVTLTKTLDTPSPVVAGTDATFTLQATDAGPSDATQVIVTDTLPDYLIYQSASGTDWDCGVNGQVITCTIPTLPADPPAAGVAPITVVAKVDPATPFIPVGSTTTLVNTASIDTATPGVLTQPDPVDVPVVADADLALTKTAAAPSVAAGDSTTWDFAVTNHGPSDAAGPLTITDTLPGYQSYLSSSGTGWTCVPGPAPDPASASAQQSVTCTQDDGLAAGDTAAALAVEVQVDPTAPVGTETNTATVSSPTQDSDPDNNTSSAAMSVTRDVELAIVKSHTGDGQVGQPITFQLAVSNNGDSTADQIVVSDTLPSGLDFVDAQGSDWTCSDNLVGSDSEVTCSLAGTLAPHSAAAPILLTTTVDATAYPGVTNTATVSSTDPDLPGTASSSDPVVVDPDGQLSITKTHIGTLRVGSTATYDILVANTGPTATPGPIVVTDPLPAALSYVSASGTGWSCGDSGQLVTCSRTGDLAVGASATVSIVVAVLPSAYPALTNTATATAPGSTPVSGSDAAAVLPQIVLSAVKSLDSYLDNVATYSITVHNSGANPTVAPTVVSDPLPSGLHYVSASGTGWKCQSAGQTVTCTHAGAIGSNASSRVVLVADVSAGVGSVLRNTARVTTGSSPQKGGGHIVTPTGAISSVSNTVVLTVTASGSLAATGASTQAWLELALLLLISGAGALILARKPGRHRS